ncbi:MAG TPA: hypothetical protein VLD65_11630 [Anaerolineales bacterium]|nr:hypothetical protein [Anaerolineales bacterium]
MSSKSVWIASLGGAAVSLLVANLPFISFVNCLLCSGFWGSAIFAVWLYHRLGNVVSIRKGVMVGALSGLIAGILGFALSFVGLAGLQGMLNNAQQILPPDATKGMEDIPAWGAYIFNFLGVLFEVGAGTLGGWIGAVIFDPNRQSKKELVKNENHL